MLRNLAIIVIALLFFPLSAHAISQKEASDWLKGKKVPYTSDEFVNRASQGDISVVNLFLDAGMDPDAKDKRGETAMQVAIERARGDIIEILVERNADISPLLSSIGDKDALVQDIKALGYLIVRGEFSSDDEHFTSTSEEDQPATTIETCSFVPRSESVTLLSPQVYRELLTEQEGGFGGLGIVISLDANNALTVMRPIEGTPASRAGVLTGDKIIEIEGESTKGITLEEALEKLRGLQGSRANITVKRRSTSNKDGVETLNLTLVRERIKIPSVEQKMLDSDIGYIRIDEFNRDTVDDFREGINKLRTGGMRHLVLDLRNNPGGPLLTAVDIADEFLDKGDLICATFSSYADLNTELKAQREKFLQFDTPVVALVNGGTAGASEVVAAALRDSGAGIILGEKTAGMGSVWNTVPLSDGSALKLTTAGLLMSNREAIEGVGLEPDIFAKGTLEHLNADFVLKDDEILTKYAAKEDQRDPQLQRAIEFLKGYDPSKMREQNISDFVEINGQEKTNSNN